MTNCYYNNCKNEAIKLSDTYPFCCEEHHLLWATDHFPTKKNGKPKLTVEQMQKRLVMMGKDL